MAAEGVDRARAFRTSAGRSVAGATRDTQLAHAFYVTYNKEAPGSLKSRPWSAPRREAPTSPRFEGSLPCAFALGCSDGRYCPAVTSSARASRSGRRMVPDALVECRWRPLTDAPRKSSPPVPGSNTRMVRGPLNRRGCSLMIVSRCVRMNRSIGCASCRSGGCFGWSAGGGIVVWARAPDGPCQSMTWLVHAVVDTSLSRPCVCGWTVDAALFG